MLDVVLDVETGDPDDFLTLLLLAGHPAVNLRAVTITPGSPAQVGVVRHGLALLGRSDVRVGAFNLAHSKACVSAWHYRALGAVPPSLAAEPGGRLLADACDETTTMGASPALALIHQLMAGYLDRHPAGKIIHDPLAACCAIDPGIGTWAEVEIYRERGEWGARHASGTQTLIITGYDRQRFLGTFLQLPQ